VKSCVQLGRVHGAGDTVLWRAAVFSNFERQATRGPLPGSLRLGCDANQYFPGNEVGRDAFQLLGDRGFRIMLVLPNGLAGHLVRMVVAERSNCQRGSYPRFAKKCEPAVVSEAWLLAANSVNGSHSDQSS
jgi:hypothetical protein